MLGLISERYRACRGRALIGIAARRGETCASEVGARMGTPPFAEDGGGGDDDTRAEGEEEVVVAAEVLGFGGTERTDMLGEGEETGGGAV